MPTLCKKRKGWATQTARRRKGGATRQYAYPTNPNNYSDPLGLFGLPNRPGGWGGGILYGGFGRALDSEPVGTGCTFDWDTFTVTCGGTSVPGCVADATEGCIPPPCSSLPQGCVGTPPPGPPPSTGGGGTAANNQLNQLLNKLSKCPAASAMVNDLKQLQVSGKLTVTNLGAADGSTSFTGGISIDSTYGITAHNLGHEWWHTMQRGAILFAGQAGATFQGGPLGGALAGQLGWAGARLYNSVNGLVNGTPGFGPLDKEAEAVGQQISSQCGID
jgi:hypothetical protein